MGFRIFECAVCLAVFFCGLDNRELLFQSPVIAMIPEVPREMVAEVCEKMLENREIEIRSATPDLEIVFLAHGEILVAPSLEIRDAFFRVVLSAKRFVEHFLVLFTPPVHSGEIVLKAFLDELENVEAAVEFALVAVAVEAERPNCENFAAGILPGGLDVDHQFVFHNPSFEFVC
jgi:hypothetical protein